MTDQELFDHLEAATQAAHNTTPVTKVETLMHHQLIDHDNYDFGETIPHQTIDDDESTLEIMIEEEAYNPTEEHVWEE